jgi:hypothetical protein
MSMMMMLSIPTTVSLPLTAGHGASRRHVAMQFKNATQDRLQA